MPKGKWVWHKNREEGDIMALPANKMLEIADEACLKIIEASLRWTGIDEEMSPDLRKARTLAAMFREDYRQYKQKDTTWWCCGVKHLLDQRCSCGDSFE